MAQFHGELRRFTINFERKKIVISIRYDSNFLFKRHRKRFVRSRGCYIKRKLEKMKLFECGGNEKTNRLKWPLLRCHRFVHESRIAF